MTHSTHGHRAGDSHAQKESHQSGEGVVALNQSSGSVIVAEDGTDRKAFATLQARAAMRGHTLVKCVDGYLIAKGAHSRHCTDLASVDALLKRMGS
jgi:hypothetical protein